VSTRRLILLALLGILLVACQGPFRVAGESTPDTDAPPDLSVASTLFTGNCTPEETLRLWNTPDTLDPEIVAQFGTQYGIDVTEEYFASEQEMIRGIRAGNSGYDLVFTSNEVVASMIQAGLLRELDRENIPNATNLDAHVIGLFYDPENQYTLPFQWGITGIAYDATRFQEPPTSWASLLDGEQAFQHGALFSMWDDEQETIGAALLHLGYEATDTNHDHLAEARDLLLQQQMLPNFAGYGAGEITQGLVEGTLQLAHAQSHIAAQAARDNDAIRFVIPEEGGTAWQSNVAIPADAPSPCAAELFINYLLQPDIAAQAVEYTYRNSSVPAARLLLDPITQEIMARGFMPDTETWERLTWLEAPGEPVLSDIWAELKAQQPAADQ
jgi:spermidine/putrescine transport system substrate-binding protein